MYSSASLTSEDFTTGGSHDSRVRFLSCEPLLEAVCHDLCGIGWVIVGGESGGKRVVRPMAPAWARALRDQCAAAGVPFFFKQTGSNRPDWPPSLNRKGDDLADWPADLRQQKIPAVGLPPAPRSG